MRCLAFALVFAGAALAQERASTTQQADRVMASRKDPAAFAKLAAMSQPDRWSVADELSSRGEHEVAVAFARATKLKDKEQLLAYLESRRASPTPRGTWAALWPLWNRAFAGEKDVPAVAAPYVAQGGFVGSFATTIHAVSLVKTGRAAEAVPLLERALETMEELGCRNDAAWNLFWLGQVVPDKAEHYYRRVLALEEDVFRPNASFYLGHLLLGRGRHREAAPLLRAALEHFGKKSADMRAEFEVYLANALVFSGQPREAERLAAAAYPVLKRAGNELLAASALNWMALARYLAGDLARAETLYTQALAEFEARKAAWGVANCRNGLGMIAHDRDRPADALRHFEAALASGPAPRIRAAFLKSCGAMEIQLDRLDAATARLNEAAALARTCGAPGVEAASLGQLAKIAHARGRIDEARALLARAGPLAEKSGDPEVRASHAWSLADFLHATDDTEAAVVQARRGVALHLESGRLLQGLRLLGNLVSYYRALERPDDALQTAERAMKLAATLPNRAARAGATVNLCIVLAEAKQHAPVVAAAQKELAAGPHAPAAAADLHLLAAEALEALGRREECRRHYEKAAETARGDTLRRAAHGAARQATLGQEPEVWLRIARLTQQRARSQKLDDLFLVAREWEGSALGKLSAPDDAKRILNEVREASEGVALGRVLGALGNVHRACGEWDAARRCHEQGVAVLRRTDDRRKLGTALLNLAGLEIRARDSAAAERLYGEVLVLAEKTGSDFLDGQARRGLGDVHQLRNEFAEAARRYEQARAVFNLSHDRLEEAACLYSLGGTYDRRGDRKAAGACFEEALELLGPAEPSLKAQLLCNRAIVLMNRGLLGKARAVLDEALALSERRGFVSGRRDARRGIAMWHENRGELKPAYEHIQAALALGEDSTDLRVLAANYATQLERFEEAEAHLEKARATTGGNAYFEVRVLNELGRLRHHQLDYEAAQAAHEAARDLCVKAGLDVERHASETWIAAVLGARGLSAQAVEMERRLLAEADGLISAENTAVLRMVHALSLRALGRLPEAIATLEAAQAVFEARESRLNLARALRRLGLLHADMRDYAAATAYEKRALALFRELGHRRNDAISLGNLGSFALVRGELDDAIALIERSTAIFRELGVDPSANLANLAQVYRMKGMKGRARELLAESLVAERRLGRADRIPGRLAELGRLEFGAGEREAGLARCRDALRLAEELRLPGVLLDVLRHLAAVLVLGGDYEGALATARRGVRVAQQVTRGLDDEHAAMARGTRFDVAEWGVRAAFGLGRADEAFFFAESARAGALLESLGSREQLRAAVLPPELQRVDAEARARERAAQKRYERVVAAGRRPKKEWEELKQARADVLAVVARIQRTLKARADVPYPKAASLAAVRARLRPDETFVLYSFLDGRLLAVVASRDAARIVDLGEPAPVREAIAAFRAAIVRPDERGLVLPPHERLPFLRKQLRRLLIEPLALKAKRMLVSPDQELAYVPFALLCECDIAYEASGTTYKLLSEESRKPGTKVLALGDPDYGGKHDRLPGSGKEAAAVGDVVFLRDKATRAALVEAEGHWRAVHLACHAWVDPARPALSALALADGDLRCLDVFGLNVSADLVVLSACETGKGKVYKAEGVVGFTRAFMMAGTPRVIVSLWKVDDAATQALMVKFYELWAELPAATALRKAQAFVASQEKWRHPYYWAAWQLWGLPE